MAITTLNNRSINRSDTASADQVWTATSATASDFQAVSGGKILQVVSAVDGTERSTTSTSWVTASSTLTLDITPSATTSKILLMLSTNVFISANDGSITLYRDATNLGHADYGFSYLHIIAGYTHPTIIELDSPSSTSQITYAMYIRNISGSSTMYAGSNSDEGSLIAMEIGA